MRIVGGALRNRLVKVPKKGVRPTKGIVRGAIFNIIRERVVNAQVLDLFSGSGVLGIEAISRGAKHCVFVDKSPKTLRANIENLGLTKKTTILSKDYRMAMRSLRPRLFDLILADPPYEKNFVQRILDSMTRNDLLRIDGILVIEHSPREQIQLPETFSLVKRKRYGETVITLIEHKHTENTEERETQKTLKPPSATQNALKNIHRILRTSFSEFSVYLFQCFQ